MIRLLAKRPGFALLAVLLVSATGIGLAHRDAERQTVPLSTTQRWKAATPDRSQEWSKKLDIAKATRINGKLIQTLADGTRITFTIQPPLQQSMTDYLARYELPYAGAVAFDVRSGEVLAMAGHSTENPKLGARRLCLSPWAPAASTFKVITAAGLLETGVPPSTTVCYHGGLRGLKGHHLESNPRLDTTCRTLSDAVAKSINPIIGKLALRHLDQKGLLRWAERFGFNRHIPFEFPVKRSRAQIPMERIERARTAAGFWHTEISVLHGAVIAGVPATGGQLVWPHLVREVTLADGTKIMPQRTPRRRIMQRRTANSLARMMARTTTFGSGRRGFISRRGKAFLPITVAGKTGSLARRKPFLHYSWFIGFAPAEKPEIAFAVLLGNPARWRIKASVAARKLVSEYLAQQKKPKTPRKLAHR